MYYIFNAQAGVIMSTGYKTLEECKSFAKEGGFEGYYIIKLIERI